MGVYVVGLVVFGADVGVFGCDVGAGSLGVCFVFTWFGFVYVWVLGVFGCVWCLCWVCLVMTVSGVGIGVEFVWC